MTNETRTLEEALANLARPEVRTSLETYVPASFEAMKDVRGGDEELLADAVHYMLDLKYKEKAPERDLAFLHEIVDMKKDFNSENIEQNKEALYQKGKSYVLETGFDVEDYALFVVDLFLKAWTSMGEAGKKWMQDRAPTGKLYSYCISAIKNEDYIPVDHISDEDKNALKEKSVNVKFPVVPVPFNEYFNAMIDYKIRQGLKVDETPVDISILRNAAMKFGDSIGPVKSLYGINAFYERFYSEAITETPGLKDKIVEIGRKYGVEMKTK